MPRNIAFIACLALVLMLSGAIVAKALKRPAQASNVARSYTSATVKADVATIPYSASDVIAAVNEVRAKNGQPALVENARLNATAQNYANTLCATNVWQHGDWRTQLTAHGYNYYKAGENLAYGSYRLSLSYFIQGWVDSPEHFANMIDPVYADTGVGVLLCPSYQGQDNMVILVQHFGKLQTPVATAPAPKKATPACQLVQ